MQKTNKENKGKISKKLIIAAVVTTVAFAFASTAVFYALFYRKSDTYELMFPDLVGSYEQDIQTDSRFNIEKNYIFSDIYPKGVVISQSPNGLSAQKIPRGTVPTLTLNISLGKESFIMPDLSGMTLTDAERMLRQMQCKARIVRIYDDDSTESFAETVLRSYPGANGSVFLGDEVVLYIQTPRAVEKCLIPSLVGLDVENAARILSSLGVSYEITDGFDSNAAEGEVISQSPAPNNYIDKKTTVIITVNSD